MKSTKETTTMSDLPEDLVEEILSWVPATSLKPLRSTCKRWKALLKEPRFNEKHFRKAPKQSCVLMLKEYRLFPTSIDLNVVPPSIEFKGALDLNCSRLNREQLDIAEVFHCDGLLLCITKENRPVVCNPYLGETRWIQHENGYKRYSRFALGYENNKSGRTYKILMFWESGHPESGFEIYEFSSNSWRVVDAPSWVTIRYSGVTLKGNAYWIYGHDKDRSLLSFDFTRERFGRLSPTSQRRSCMALSVVRDEQLSDLHWSVGSAELEMWATNNINSEAELSWSKSFAVDMQSSSLFTSLLIDGEKKVALICSSCYTPSRNVVYIIGEDDQYYAEIPHITEPWLLRYNSPGGGSRWPFFFNYVPSLVQIQS